MMMELKRNLSLASYFSARRAYLHRKKIYPQACRVMASLTASRREGTRSRLAFLARIFYLKHTFFCHDGHERRKRAKLKIVSL